MQGGAPSPEPHGKPGVTQGEPGPFFKALGVQVSEAGELLAGVIGPAVPQIDYQPLSSPIPGPILRG